MRAKKGKGINDRLEELKKNPVSYVTASIEYSNSKFYTMRLIAFKYYKKLVLLVLKALTLVNKKNSNDHKIILCLVIKVNKPFANR